MPYLGRMTEMQREVIPQFTMSDRLRKARELTGLDKGQFADELGVSRNSVANAEAGHSQPRRITLRAWALRTGVPLEWLETGKTPAGQSPSGGSHQDEVRHQGLEPRTRWLAVTAGQGDAA